MEHQPGEPVEDISDQDLMRLVAQGDQEAFDFLYLRYKARLRKFIAGFVQDETAAEDLLQETFLRVYKNAGKFTPGYRFTGWLYRIATNQCLNELRRRRTHPVVSLNSQIHVAVTDSESETVELYELIPDSSYIGPSQSAESRETRQRIMAAVEGLSPAHRQTVTLRLQGELNYEQIAGELNVSVGTAKSRIFYGLRALRERLEPEFDLE